VHLDPIYHALILAYPLDPVRWKLSVGKYPLENIRWIPSTRCHAKSYGDATHGVSGAAMPLKEGAVRWRMDCTHTLLIPLYSYSTHTLLILYSYSTYTRCSPMAHGRRQAQPAGVTHQSLDARKIPRPADRLTLPPLHPHPHFPSHSLSLPPSPSLTLPPSLSCSHPTPLLLCSLIGQFSADEHLGGRNPNRGVELCAIVETVSGLQV
jgi:hypothetical protein